MIFVGKREALNFISEWENKMDLNLYKEWNAFKQNRNSIAVKMGLNEKELILITVVYLADYIEKYLRNTNYVIFLNSSSETNSAEVMKLIGEITDVHYRYLAKCLHFKPEFDREMQKLNSHRR